MNIGYIKALQGAACREQAMEHVPGDGKVKQGDVLEECEVHGYLVGDRTIGDLDNEEGQGGESGWWQRESHIGSCREELNVELLQVSQGWGLEPALRLGA